MFNRWIEPELLGVLEREGVGCIAFTALDQGLLTDRYINGVPADSRAAQGKSLDPNSITNENLARVRALNEIAKGRGQTLAQMALAWVLRDPRMTSTLVAASSVSSSRTTWQRSSAPNSVPTSWLRLIGTRLNPELICRAEARERLFVTNGISTLAQAACSTAFLSNTPGGRSIAILADELGAAERWSFERRRP